MDFVKSDCPNCKTRDAEMRRSEGAIVALTCKECGEKWAAPNLGIAQEHTPEREYQ